MFDKMKQLMEMKKQAEVIKRELENAKVQTSIISGITIEINGTQNFNSIEIDSNLLKPENKARLQADLLKSLNAAVRSSQNVAAQKMKGVFPGFPGL